MFITFYFRKKERNISRLINIYNHSDDLVNLDDEKFELFKKCLKYYHFYNNDYRPNDLINNIIIILFEKNLYYFDKLLDDNFFIFTHMPEKIKKNKEYIISKLKKRGVLYKYLDFLKSDKEVIQSALENRGHQLQYVPQNLITKELCYIAIRQNSQAYEYIPNIIKSDFNFIIELLKLDKLYYGDDIKKYILNDKNLLLDKKKLLELFKENIINYSDLITINNNIFDDKEFLIKILQTTINSDILKSINYELFIQTNNSSNIFNSIYFDFINALKILFKNCNFICKSNINQIPDDVLNIIFKDEELIIFLIKENKINFFDIELKYITENILNYYLVNINFFDIKIEYNYVKHIITIFRRNSDNNKTKYMIVNNILIILLEKPELLESQILDIENIIYIICKINIKLIEILPSKYKNNINLCLKLIENYYKDIRYLSCFEYFSDEIKLNKELIFNIADKYDHNIFIYIHENLYSDEQFIMEALKYDISILKYEQIGIRNDKNKLKFIIKEYNISALQYANVILRNDYDYILKLIEISNINIIYYSSLYIDERIIEKYNLYKIDKIKENNAYNIIKNINKITSKNIILNNMYRYYLSLINNNKIIELLKININIMLHIPLNIKKNKKFILDVINIKKSNIFYFQKYIFDFPEVILYLLKTK
jgi:hypothetical protein